MVRGEIRPGEPLAVHTTLRIGGPADVYVLPAGEEDVAAAVRAARLLGMPVTVLGRGSNVLVPDEGVRGMVLNPVAATTWLRFTGCRVEVGAGYPLPGLVRAAVERGLGGLEELGGIPGSVGGALCMNAGAGGQTIGEVTVWVDTVGPGGERYRLFPEELAFGYRYSRLLEGAGIVVAAALDLRPAAREALRRRLRDGEARRRRTQPLDMPNAGSVFKNPPGDHAGRLLEEAGCKGLRVGGAQISPRHANFIVNLGGATAADVLTLMGEAYRRVRDALGVRLEPEIRLLGAPPGALARILEGEVPDHGGAARR